MKIEFDTETMSYEDAATIINFLHDKFYIFVVDRLGGDLDFDVLHAYPTSSCDKIDGRFLRSDDGEGDMLVLKLHTGKEQETE